MARPEPDPYQDGVFNWAWRRATRHWSGWAATFGVALAAYLLGRNLPCVLKEDVCALLPPADGLLGHLLSPAVVLLAYVGVLVTRAGVAQRDALREAAAEHDRAWHPGVEVDFAAKLHQHAEHGVHYMVEVSGLPPGEFDAEGHAINGEGERWRVPWGIDAAETTRKPGGGTDTVRLAAVEWRLEQGEVAVMPVRTGINTDPFGTTTYRFHREHRYSGDTAYIDFQLRGDALGDSHYEVRATVWWDLDGGGPRTDVEKTLVRNPLAGG